MGMRGREQAESKHKPHHALGRVTETKLGERTALEGQGGQR